MYNPHSTLIAITKFFFLKEIPTIHMHTLKIILTQSVIGIIFV